jgi:hypothetical protein
MQQRSVRSCREVRCQLVTLAHRVGPRDYVVGGGEEVKIPGFDIQAGFLAEMRHFSPGMKVIEPLSTNLQRLRLWNYKFTACCVMEDSAVGYQFFKNSMINLWIPRLLQSGDSRIPGFYNLFKNSNANSGMYIAFFSTSNISADPILPILSCRKQRPTKTKVGRRYCQSAALSFSCLAN